MATKAALQSPRSQTDVAIKLFNEDCLHILDTLPEDSVDMIFADPPYNLSNNGITCHSGRMVSVNKGKWDESKGSEEDFLFHKLWIEKCRRVLKPSGTIWVSGTYHSIYACGYALQLQNFHILNDIIWFKPNASPNLSCRFFTASHETLIWARKDSRARHTFNYESIKGGDFPEDTFKKPDKQMRSVWAIGTPRSSEKKNGKHPTQKPLSLLERIVKACTKERDMILDPFMGSGTTGVAAVMNGRNFIGIETEKEFFELACKRLKEMEEARDAKTQ